MQIPTPQIFDLNNEWTVKFSPLPDNFHLEVSRKSTIETAHISGILEQKQEERIIDHFSFEQLFRKGLTSALITLPVRILTFPDIVFKGTIAIKNENFSTEMTEWDEIQHKSWAELSNSFERLLNPEVSYFSDVSFICGSVTIPAHKSILSARSPVFAAMFTSQMKENAQGRVNITDMEEPVLRAMLVHIYTGKTKDLNVGAAGDLLFAAEKYQLEDLKRVCCDYLKENMTLENVLNTLVLGHLHDEDLKACAMKFICEYCANIFTIEETPEWKLLRKERPQLAMDVLTALVKSKEKN